MTVDKTSARIGPESLPLDDDADLAFDAWGFRDTAFRRLENGNVVLGGNRYALSGIELPSLVPWVSKVMDIQFPDGPSVRPPHRPTVPHSRASDALLAALRDAVPDATISTEPLVRLRHGHGHTVDEIYAVRNGGLPRVPDAVVFPTSTADVCAIVSFAANNDVCLLAFGGGTNVTEALRCPEDETRVILSVDMRRMNRILWIDRTNMTARIEAGAVGRHIAAALAEHGLTIGHEPDSYEFSTLGGWIATHASGMKKNRYGNIEDLLLDVHVVTTDGLVARTPVVPRDSIGVDPRRWIMGSEGRFGIVTDAVVRLRPLPQTEQFDAVVFPDFDAGVRFLHDLTRTGRLPASVRLVDNMQFQLSQTLKPAASGAKAVKRQVEKWYVTRLRGFDPDRMVACTLLFEGDATDVALQRQTVTRLAKRHGGLHAGAENGRKGYQLTFGIAYLRDFVMDMGLLAESFETTVSWTDVVALIDRTRARIVNEHTRLGLPGRPFITARVTQLYDSGVCVYFYLGIHPGDGDRPTDRYALLAEAARDEILESGGSLSHHHGVGRLRRHYLTRVLSPAAQSWDARLKQAIDPQHLFGVIDT